MEKRGDLERLTSLTLPWLVAESKPRDNFINVSRSPPPAGWSKSFLAGRNLSPVPTDTEADGKVSSTARTQWLLVLPFTELNVRFRLSVLCKGKEPWRLYNANGYSIHIHFLPPGSWRKFASWSTEGLNKELQHPVVLTCAIPIWITPQM